MSELKGVGIVVGLTFVVCSVASADIMPGTWASMTTDLQAGTWLETFGPEGPGRPGTELSAQAGDALQWMLGGIFILAPAEGNDNGDGTITYTTAYGNAADPGASSLALAEGLTLWGDAMAFTNLMITVEATIQIDTREYLGGWFYGSAEGIDAAAGYTIMITGMLSETGLIADPPGHEGTVDPLLVSIVPAPVPPTLDIKPGSCPNPLNIKSQGKLPIAILGTVDFDVSMIDPSTITLSRADGVGGSVSPLEGPPGPHLTIEDRGAPFYGEACTCHEWGPDGYDDLAMKFSRPEVMDVLELADLQLGGSVELVVSGMLLDGTELMVSDCVVLKPKRHWDGDRKRRRAKR